MLCHGYYTQFYGHVKSHALNSIYHTLGKEIPNLTVALNSFVRAI